MGIREWLSGQPKRQQVEGVFLEGDEMVAAVGEASYQPALQKLCGSTRWEDIRCDVRAVLEPEPGNPYDRNAVMVRVDGQRVGYLSRGDALDYQPVVRQLDTLGMVAVCGARIAGRGQGSETSNLGIFLMLPGPDDALLQVVERSG